MRFRLNDDDYVSRLRRLQAIKRIGAVCLIVLGLAISLGLVRLLLDHREQAIAAFDEMREVVSPTTNEALRALDVASESSAFSLGFSAGAWFAGGVALIAGGFLAIVNSRRDRLLLKHYTATGHVT